MKDKPYWKVISSDLGYGLECTNCNRKISVLDALMSDSVYNVCPFCKSNMDMDKLDYNELLTLADSERSV